MTDNPRLTKLIKEKALFDDLQAVIDKHTETGTGDLPMGDCFAWVNVGIAELNIPVDADVMAEADSPNVRIGDYSKAYATAIEKETNK